MTIDKHKQSFDASAAAAIMRIGVPRGSGIYLASPPKQEILTTNLLPIENWPTKLSMAPAGIQDYADGWRRIAEAPGHAVGWIWHGGMIVSFGDLSASPLSELCDGPAEQHDTAEWAGSADPDVTRQFSDLLRRTLVSDRSEDVRWHQAHHHLHFRATRDLGPRVVGRGKGRRGRTVFGPHFTKADPDKVSYYHHAALSPRFRRLGEAWYCQLGVDYCFTRDGTNESSFADTLTAGIKRLERHPAVRGWTTMWETYLRGAPASALLTFGSLLTFPVDRGIDEAWWGPAPAAGDGEDSSPAATDADLRQADIDQDDLRHLVEDETPTQARPSARARRRVPARASRAARPQSNRSGS